MSISFIEVYDVELMTSFRNYLSELKPAAKVTGSFSLPEESTTSILVFYKKHAASQHDVHVFIFKFTVLFASCLLSEKDIKVNVTRHNLM